MAKKKSEPDKLVRLSNGVVEREKGVGQIVMHLRTLALNNPAQFEFLAHFVAGKDNEPPDHLVAKLKTLNFVEEDEPLKLYDDVRDVVECCTQWAGNRARFDTKDLLAVDQTNLAIDEGEDEVP